MNKSDLIAEIAKKSGLTKKDAEKSLSAFIETVKATVAKKKKVQLIGFGTFEARTRKARNGKNPRTGETIKIAKANVPAFKAGKLSKMQLTRDNLKIKITCCYGNGLFFFRR